MLLTYSAQKGLGAILLRNFLLLSGIRLDSHTGQNQTASHRRNHQHQENREPVQRMFQKSEIDDAHKMFFRIALNNSAIERPAITSSNKIHSPIFRLGACTVAILEPLLGQPDSAEGNQGHENHGHPIGEIPAYDGARTACWYFGHVRTPSHDPIIRKERLSTKVAVEMLLK